MGNVVYFVKSLTIKWVQLRYVCTYMGISYAIGLGADHDQRHDSFVMPRTDRTINMQTPSGGRHYDMFPWLSITLIARKFAALIVNDLRFIVTNSVLLPGRVYPTKYR